MGFFVSEEEEAAAILIARKSTKKAPAPLPQALGCETCSLKKEWPALAHPKMPLDARRGADLLILGEAPGEREDQEGRPFVGKAGQFLREHLPSSAKDRVAFQNVVRCRPPDNRTPSNLEMQSCSEHLIRDIEALKPKAILGLGTIPFLAAWGEKTPPLPISDIRGIRFPAKFGSHLCWFFPTFHPSYLERQGGRKHSAFPLFQSDLSEFFRGVDFWDSPAITELDPSQVIQVMDEGSAKSLAQTLGPIVAIDIETSGLRPYRPNEGRKELPIILCASASDGKTTFAWPIFHPEAYNQWGMKLLLQIVHQKKWIAHNATFEMLWLLYADPDWNPFDSFFDTMAMARIRFQRAGTSLLSLDSLSRIFLGCHLKAIFNVDRSATIGYPLSTLLPYCGLDSLAAFLIFEKLNHWTPSEKPNLARLHDTIASTTIMQFLGLHVDRQKAQEFLNKFQETERKIQNEAHQLYEVQKFEKEFGKPFQISSSQDVGLALRYGGCELPKSAKNGFSTRESELLKYADSNPLASLVLQYRENHKLIQYCAPIAEGDLLGNDGLFHPGYTTCFVRTGRLSGTDGSIQTWPERKHRELRQQIIPPKDCILVSADQGQLEARVLAMASRDEKFCQEIIKKVDVHSKWRDRILKIYPKYEGIVAERVGEKDPDKLLKAIRSEVKNDFVFALFYGSSIENCSERMQIPIDVMRELVAAFWKDYSGVKEWHRRMREQYEKLGISRTLTERVRKEVLTGNEPINNPIQGTAADLVLDGQNALMRLAYQEADPYLIPRINVHDELVFFLPEDEEGIEQYIRIIAREMTRIRYDWMVVPLSVEFSVGRNWGELSEFAVIEGDYAPW